LLLKKEFTNSNVKDGAEFQIKEAALPSHNLFSWMMMNDEPQYVYQPFKALLEDQSWKFSTNIELIFLIDTKGPNSHKNPMSN